SRSDSAPTRAGAASAAGRPIASSTSTVARRTSTSLSSRPAASAGTASRNPGSSGSSRRNVTDLAPAAPSPWPTGAAAALDARRPGGDRHDRGGGGDGLLVPPDSPLLDGIQARGRRHQGPQRLARRGTPGRVGVLEHPAEGGGRRLRLRGDSPQNPRRQVAQ